MGTPRPLANDQRGQEVRAFTALIETWPGKQVNAKAARRLFRKVCIYAPAGDVLTWTKTEADRIGGWTQAWREEHPDRLPSLEGWLAKLIRERRALNRRAATPEEIDTLNRIDDRLRQCEHFATDVKLPADAVEKTETLASRMVEVAAFLAKLGNTRNAPYMDLDKLEERVSQLPALVVKVRAQIVYLRECADFRAMLHAMSPEEHWAFNNDASFRAEWSANWRAAA